MAVNYAQAFQSQIEQKFATELTSADMAQNNKYKFINAQTVNVPTITLSGYKDHKRDGSKNRGKVGNEYQPMKLTHDRDIEFFVDDMDVDETNQVLSAANITATFMDEQSIPETDAYRYSKLYADFTNPAVGGGSADTTELSAANILSIFDKAMEQMNDAGVPANGRQMKCIPAVYTMLKNAAGLQRTVDVKDAKGNIVRDVYFLDGVKVTMVPSDRMKSAYDFADGFKAALTAKQINMMIYHPSCLIAPVKVADVYLWGKGETPDSAFGYLYQNRSYQDLFLIKAKAKAVFINTTA